MADSRPKTSIDWDLLVETSASITPEERDAIGNIDPHKEFLFEPGMRAEKALNLLLTKLFQDEGAEIIRKAYEKTRKRLIRDTGKYENRVYPVGISLIISEEKDGLHALVANTPLSFATIFPLISKCIAELNEAQDEFKFEYLNRPKAEKDDEVKGLNKVLSKARLSANPNKICNEKVLVQDFIAKYLEGKEIKPIEMMSAQFYPFQLKEDLYFEDPRKLFGTERFQLDAKKIVCIPFTKEENPDIYLNQDNSSTFTKSLPCCKDCKSNMDMYVNLLAAAKKIGLSKENVEELTLEKRRLGRERALMLGAAAERFGLHPRKRKAVELGEEDLLDKSLRKKTKR